MPGSDQHPGISLVYRIDKISTLLENQRCFAESPHILKNSSRTFKGILDLFGFSIYGHRPCFISQLFFEKAKLQAALCTQYAFVSENG